MRVLLVEDDPTLQTAVRQYFARESWTIDCAPTISAARACLPGRYDVVVLDLGLPDGDGLSLLPAIARGDEPAATLVLTARDRLSDRVRGLDAGADDYLVKPFDLDELAARLRALARRRTGHRSPMIELPPVSIDTTSREIRVNGTPVDLTAREYVLTLALALQPRRVLSRRQLEDAIYPLDDCAISNVVEVYISRLRRKLGRDAIETVRGIGYRWGAIRDAEP